MSAGSSSISAPRKTPASSYSSTHTFKTFDEYVEVRWQISPAQAYRWISEWRIAVAISPIGEKNVNESQVRELMPIATRHGPEAAVAMYAALVQEARERRVTATLIKGAVAALPAGDGWDADAAAEAVRAYLADLDAPEPDPVKDDPDAAWKVQADRLRSSVSKTVRRRTFLDNARSHPAEAREFVTELVEELQGVLRALAEEEPQDQE